MPDSGNDMLDTTYYFVDEAGDPNLFDRKGRVMVGTEGCSKYFILGKLDIADHRALSDGLAALRASLLADPYLRGMPSMQPEAKKTATAFHATDDLPEVRREVFRFLEQQKEGIRFYAVVRDKHELVSHESQKRESDPVYRYSPNGLYDTLVSELFRKFRHATDRVHICFAKRGRRNRTRALEKALEHANVEFERSYGFRNKAETRIDSCYSHESGGLQAVDYYLWALQRFYERAEERYVEFIWPQVGDIHDLDFIEGDRRGVIYRGDKRLNLEARLPKKKKRRI